ncbi:unnamed protein product [Staurois parvus]|jgi:thymidine phosphorylase
MLSM